MLPMDKRRMRIASSHEAEWEQRSLTGIYGSFVCKNCENRFAVWDDYAATVLRKAPIDTESGWDFGKYDYGKLSRFFLSILWRMHACGHRFFATVDLGSQVDSLACFLRKKDYEKENMPQNFEVVPTWSSHLLSLGVLTPIEVRIADVPYWQIYLPRFQALIKPVAEPGALCLQPFAMANGKTLCMLEKQFTEFNEIESFYGVATENIEKKNMKNKRPPT